jgi:hypothetical protein
LNAIWQGCEQEQARTGKKDQIESDDHVQATAFSLPVHRKPGNLSRLADQEKPQLTISAVLTSAKCCNTFRMRIQADFERFSGPSGRGCPARPHVAAD